VKRKRGAIIADLHGGHVVGLTHPDFDAKPNSLESPERALYELRRELYKWFMDEIKELGRLDFLIVNGDAIDGKGDKTGGTEELIIDRDLQCDNSSSIIDGINASKIYMTYGTPYHVGLTEDFENKIASDVGAVKIGSHDWLDVNGLIFDYKHFVSSSSIPHGRHTAIARDWLWSRLWAERGEYPKSDILIRSHVHYLDYAGGADWLGIITPALQWYGSKLGKRRMSGTVDFGFLHFDVTSKEDWTWHPHILRRKTQAQTILKV
jgi:hypothetical protein